MWFFILVRSERRARFNTDKMHASSALAVIWTKTLKWVVRTHPHERCNWKCDGHQVFASDFIFVSFLCSFFRFEFVDSCSHLAWNSRVQFHPFFRTQCFYGKLFEYFCNAHSRSIFSRSSWNCTTSKRMWCVCLMCREINSAVVIRTKFVVRK